MTDLLSFASICAQSPADPSINTSHQLPLYATSSFEFDSVEQSINIFEGKEDGYVYSRYSNPTVKAVENKIAALEAFNTGIEAGCLLVSSGMAAISTLVLSVCKTGDKIIALPNIYGGSGELFEKIIKPLGIDILWDDMTDMDVFENTLKNDPAIKLVYFETPTNPTLSCTDIESVATIATRYEVKTAVDNTFATPYLQRPLALGIDFVIHSTTKYLNGHGNSIAGAIIAKDKGFLRDKIWQTLKLAGTNCSPFEAWLTNNGMRTLTLRMDKQCANAFEIAKYLSGHPDVVKVNYPGLPTHTDHLVAKKQMSQYGAMLSFELSGGFEQGIRFLNKIRLCTVAPTLGDIDTLALHPASSSHLRTPPEIRQKFGITDGLVRLSVGIESVEDIISDIDQAVKA